jgi:hypothetical protein
LPEHLGFLRSNGNGRSQPNKQQGLIPPLFFFFTAVYLIGAVCPVGRPWLNLATIRTDLSYASMVQAQGCQNISEFKESGFDVAAQYLSRTNVAASRWLLR